MSDFQRLKELVARALELPPDQREAFLESSGADAGLLAEARELVAHDDRTGADLTKAVAENVAFEAHEAFHPPTTPDRIADYEVLETLGAGGMGVVYRARQKGALEREVALKLIRPGFDSRKVIARFESERRALARMEHPNIARVFDAGTTTDGLPWFAMEHVDGEPIHEWCDARAMGLEERLRLFEDVCRGVQHAHQKGVIHRDIKPSNVLVTERDGRAVPKIIDFGISKALDEAGPERDGMTVEGQFLGTPEYMSPERLRGEDTEVDIRTDVYSMGVLLYHLLSGHLPFDRSTIPRTGRPSDDLDTEASRPSTRVTTRDARTDSIAQRRATVPRRLRRQLTGDLDWITLKALALRPQDRYDTVASLLDDIERHRRGHPVAAAPPTVRYRLAKFVRRHRTFLGATALIVVALSAGLVESNRQRLRAEAAREEADSVTRFLTEMLASVRAEEMGRDVTVQAVLDEASRSLATGLKGQELVRARLLTTLGRTYLALGRGGPAIERLDEAIRLRRMELGPRSPATLESRHHRAVALRDAGELEAAIEELEELFALRREVLGPRHVHTLGTLTDLGGAYQQNGETRKARETLEEAHEGFRLTRGPRDPDTVNTGRNLGNLLAENGELDEAEPLLRHALEVSREERGLRHPETIACLQSMALLHYDRGEHEECERLLTQVYEANRDLHGGDHPETLSTAINLASIRSNIGELESALQLLEESLPVCRESLGDEHRITLTCLNNLAFAHGQQGRDDLAEPLLEEVVETRRRVRGEDHLFTLISWNNLGELYLRTGRPAEAERVHRRVLELRRSSLGADHPHVMVSMTNLANALREQGEFEEARLLYEDSWERQRASLGAGHPDALRTAEEAVRLHEAWGGPDGAARWKERASRKGEAEAAP